MDCFVFLRIQGVYCVGTARSEDGDQGSLRRRQAGAQGAVHMHRQGRVRVSQAC